MEFAATIADHDIMVLGLILFATQLIIHEIGFYLGRSQKNAASHADIVGVVVGAMVGLLVFVLALTLSFANARFSERRLGSLAETNAIGTAWYRATAVGGPRGERIASLLQDYTKVRKDFVGATRNQSQINALNDRTSALQAEIWGNVTAIVREQPNVISSSLMSAVNEVFDASTAERFAFEMRLPAQVFWLLIGMTLLTMACLGFQFGLRDKQLRVLVGLLILMWTSVIVDILDLASARIGEFRTDTTAYEWTLQGFTEKPAIPMTPPSP